MIRTNYLNPSLLFALFLYSSCASYDAQYDDSAMEWMNKDFSKGNIVDHTFYFIGDGGITTKESIDNHFSQLKNELSSSPKNSTLLFLGDNIYDEGMPKKDDPNRDLAENILDLQIGLSENFKGQTIFIPGNHDYYSDGVKGLEREAKYITSKLDSKNAFLPKDGCPLKKVDISEDVVLIIVDTQWYLENWDDNPTINDNCEIKTRAHFFEEFEGLIKKNNTKTTLIALHHPMFTNEPHDGNYSWKQQLYPIGNNIPLPIVGSVINLVRKTSGISPQDLQNPMYSELRNRIITLSQKSERTIFISGHEHSLQFINKDNSPQIVSGSGSKTSAVRNARGGMFSYSGIGYAKLDIYKNGSSVVSYFSEENGQSNLLFKTKIYEENSTNKSESLIFESFPDTIKASIYSKEEVNKNKFYTKFMGEHYREVYGTNISAQTALLDTLYGGLTPTRSGGGHQSRSLRLKDKNGKEFVMRALRKSATQYFQSVVFKDEYIEGLYDDTYTEELMLDFYTAAHPYTPFVISGLADAVGVYHTNPRLFYIPKQKALEPFNDTYGDELYMIEERAASGHGDVKSFGFSDELISTNDLLKKLRKSDDNSLDEISYIRARLFDMLIGDWDRHQDQWRWAEFKDGKKNIYKPVPRDRDQAFSKFDGLLLQISTSLVYDISMMKAYNDDIKKVERFNISGKHVDLALIRSLHFKDWEIQVKYIQENLTDEIIEKSFEQIPTEVNDENIEDIKRKLKNRLQNLPSIAERYFNRIEKYGIVIGNDKDNWFEIERLDNGDTKIEVFNIKDDKKGSQILEKTFKKELTKVIWVYGLDDEDIFLVTGATSNVIPLKIIGGQNNDDYRISSGKKVTMYDFKSKKNTFATSNGKKILTDNYDLNTYNYKKIKNKTNIITPILGYNPDDGIKLGISNVLTVNGYNRNPFTQQHITNASYYFATKGFDLKYSGEFANIFNKWNFLIEGTITSPNYTINFYDFGNETENFEDEFDDDYHRVRFSALGVYPSIKWVGRMGTQFNIGTLYETVEVEKTEGRFVETLTYVTEDRQRYMGANATYKYKNKDDEAFPTLGLMTEFNIGWKSNIDNTDNFAYITPSLGIAYKLDTSGKIVLATKLKGNIIIGDAYEFYYGASIGGKDGLRGYRNQRFTGTKSFYQNTDLRFNLGNFKTRLVPLKLGVFGGFDYGRVWLKGEDSNDWKTSYGAGVWFVGANMININLSLFNSEEGNYFKFGLGFGF